jgi:hypothetical protein
VQGNYITRNLLQLAVPFAGISGLIMAFLRVEGASVRMCVDACVCASVYVCAPRVSEFACACLPAGDISY